MAAASMLLDVDQVRIVRWLAALRLLPHPERCSDSPVRLHAEIRDGVLLCQLVNILRPGTVGGIILNLEGSKDASTTKKAAVHNLGLFVVGCEALLARDLFDGDFKPEGFYSHAEGIHKMMAALHCLMESHSPPDAFSSSSPTLNKIGKKESKSDDIGAHQVKASTRRAIALFAFAAMRSDELTFNEGAVVELITTPTEGWWEGRIGDQFGWFPTPYVQEIQYSTAEPQPDPPVASPAPESNSHPLPENDFRPQVLQDILTTEYEFLSSIEAFLRAVASPLRALPSMPAKAKRALLGQLFKVVQVHSRFYDELRHLEQPAYGGLFVKHLKDFTELYTQYHSAHPLMCSVMTRYADDPGFAGILRQHSVEAALPLIMAQPMDRLTAYGRLLRELDRQTPANDPDKTMVRQAAKDFDSLNAVAQQKRKLKLAERTILLSGVKGLTRSQISTLPDLEYHLNFLQPGPNGALRERTLLVFHDVALVIAQEQGEYVLKETINLRSTTVTNLGIDLPYENSLQLGNLIMSTASPAECTDAINALRIATQLAQTPTVRSSLTDSSSSDRPASASSTDSHALEAIVAELQRTIAEMRTEIDHVNARLELEVSKREALERRLLHQHGGQ